jgi:superfamily II DNA or RNA helicase
LKRVSSDSDPLEPLEALEAARGAIAHAILGADRPIEATLGSVTLRPHQQLAAARIVQLIDANNGAMLAEPVGLGKTYVALAVARRWPTRLIVVPASLREMWREALNATGVDAELVTHEALSRGRSPIGRADIVVIDEAHRLRSPATRRYAAVADMCARTSVLLLTATPIHNRRDDLAAQLALFLGRSAWRSTETELVAHVVRDTVASDARGLPELDGPHRLVVPSDDDCLDELLALPLPIPASDEGTAAALFTYTLVHQWASSQGALLASLKRRLARSLALRSAIESGRQPSKRELAAWCYADDAQQLAFPELVASNSLDGGLDANDLLAAIDAHANAVRALIARLRSSTAADVERASLIRDLRARHPGERVIAFCQYAETVDALFRLLSRDAGVAALTSHGARVAGGRLPRRELLAQFTPGARGAPSEAERIDLLLTTDLLSEGLNLQEASVVVHVDLPWNPARLDQRVGRVRRLGSRHRVVTLYAVSPPASTERLLHAEARLREKLRVAQQAVGVAGSILPSPFGAPADDDERGVAEEWGAIRAKLRDWTGPEAVIVDEPLAAAVVSSVRGFVAAIDENGKALLVCDLGNGIDTRPAALRTAFECASGDAIECDTRLADEVRLRLEHWLANRRGASSIDLHAALTARSRRAALNRVAAALARAPRHRRTALAPLAAAVRAVVTTTLPEGAERVLDTLVRADLPDEAWLRSVAAFGELNARPRAERRAGARVIAIIMWGSDPS